MFYLVPTDIPTSFSANAISPNIINTTWEPPTAYHLGGVITTYTLTYRGIERDTPLKVKILSVLNGSIYITPALTELQEDTRYVISVRANTSVGAGPWTNLTVHTPEDGELSLLLILFFRSYIFMCFVISTGFSNGYLTFLIDYCFFAILLFSFIAFYRL